MKKENSPDKLACDWRVDRVAKLSARLTDKSGNVIEGPAEVSLADAVRYGKEVVGFSVPCPAALLLNLSFRLHNQAEQVLTTSIEVAGKTKIEDTINLPSGEAFEFFENYMGSIVFAHTALEAFVNGILPDSFVYEFTRKGKDFRYGKVEIERFVSLEDKLGTLLPKALNITSPRQSRIWKQFKDLEAIRHNVIHLKSENVHSHKDNRNTIWSRLMISPLPRAYRIAKNTMSGFYERTNAAPRWFIECPF